MSVIEWTIGGGSVMFIMGLISAVGSRRRKINLAEKRGQIDDAPAPMPIVYVGVPIEQKSRAPRTAMSMAAEGTGNVSVNAFNSNAEENLASIGSHSR